MLERQDVIEEAAEETNNTPTESLVQSLVPYYIDGDKKAAFLGYLVAGFSKHDAARLTGIHFKTYHRWVDSDPAFVEFMAKIPDVRHKLSDELLDLEFTRNFKLVLGRDFKVLHKDATGQELTEAEQQYLLAIRKFYTPQHLVMLRQLLSGQDESGKAFDFTQTVLEIRLSKETRRG